MESMHYLLINNSGRRRKVHISNSNVSSIKGICESIYWKPTFHWIIDEIRVINPIRTQNKGIRPINYNGGNTLSYYTYLCDVEYEVRAHFEWNLNRPDLEVDETKTNISL